MAEQDRVRISVGPQHPALKEPTSFTLNLIGETIKESSVRLGYNHRGIEKACEERTYIAGCVPHRANLRHLLAFALDRVRQRRRGDRGRGSLPSAPATSGR